LADGPIVLVVSDQRDWHARQMEAAFAAVGARVERIDLADCGFDTRSPSGLSLPDAERLLNWDATLKSRAINPGTSADLTVATLFASRLASLRGDKCAAPILP
jgi:hypothetical protein